jgi:hypothetical protein
MDASSYDQIPYTSVAFPQTHPDPSRDDRPHLRADAA